MNRSLEELAQDLNALGAVYKLWFFGVRACWSCFRTGNRSGTIPESPGARARESVESDLRPTVREVLHAEVCDAWPSGQAVLQAAHLQRRSSNDPLVFNSLLSWNQDLITPLVAIGRSCEC